MKVLGLVIFGLVGGGLVSAQPQAHEMHHGSAIHAHGSFSAGEPGNPKEPSRVVEVVMGRQGSKMFFRPDVVEVMLGEQIRFVLRNVDQLKDHEFVLATAEENREHAEEMKKSPDMEHNDPNGKRLVAKEKKELFWRFSQPGEFEFSCNIPGHREAGMVGKVIVR